jgi:DNA invertase Pin-like site-specific DNA recombinase
MTNYAYLRVSTDKQDVENQRYGILDYANERHLGTLRFVEDSISGQVDWRSRSLGKLLAETRTGDIIVFSEISRIARRTLQVLEVLEFCQKREVEVHIVKQNMILDRSIASTITATVLGLAAEIDRSLISMRTIESLAKRRAEGLPLGRPKGSKSNVVKLDEHREKIQEYLQLGLNKRSISKLVGCAPQTLYNYLDRHNLRSA